MAATPRTGSLWRWTLTQDSTGRADTAILEALESGAGAWIEGEPVSASRSQIKRLIEEGCVASGGSPVKAGLGLRAGDTVDVRFPPPRPSEVEPEERDLELLYEDEHLLVVNKPPGLTVHPSPTAMEGTLVNALLHHVKTGRIGALSGIGGVLRPGIVHRLDKDTSGSLVVTKTDEAHRKLTEVFAAHAIERRYWALCYGTMRAEKATIESTIGRNPNDRKKMAMNVKDGRRAVTHARRIEEYGVAGKSPFASWLELTLETGRTHQIRVHLTSQGNSLIGDPVYGAVTEKQGKWLLLPQEVRVAARALPGQALHARVLGFEHPITGAKLRFEAEPPAGFRALLESLQRFR